jgi:hypothetical protein
VNAPELATRECAHPRCVAQVVEVLVIGDKSMTTEVIDPEPEYAWPVGKFYLRPIQPDDGRVAVGQVRAARQAFARPKMYRSHRESCAGGTGRSTRSRES